VPDDSRVLLEFSAGGLVLDEQGRVLLIRARDLRGQPVWTLPKGALAPGETSAEAALREVREETGIDCAPVRLIALLDGLRLGFTRVPLYSLVFLCRAVGGELTAHPLETRAVGWFADADLPEPLAGASQWREHAFRAIQGENVGVLYDEPRDRPWASGA